MANLFESIDKTNEFDTDDISKNNAVAGLSYILFFIPLLASPSSRFGKFHANQSLLIWIAEIALTLISGIVGIIPVIGGLVGTICGILQLVAGILAIYGLIMAFQGKAKTLPLIGALGIDIIKY